MPLADVYFLGSKNRWMSIADTIHGIIRFDRKDETHRLLLDVINSRPFQRLRRIRQMGMAEFVFPNAIHNRFTHSMGATHLMIQTLEHLDHIRQNKRLLDLPYPGTDIPLRRLLLLGILIHDIGHPPLSHTLEDILDLKSQGLFHDLYWNRKILMEDETLAKVWDKYGTDLPQAVLAFTGIGTSKHFLSQLISSQLDMDRLDYLQRDSHFLGVQYGRIEAERLITNLDLGQLDNGAPVVVVHEEAIPAVEHYLFGRHQAYKMALHSLDKAAETLLGKTLQRFAWAMDAGIPTGNTAKQLYQLIRDGKSLSTQDFLRMDDNYLWEAIHAWSLDSQDALLKALSERLMRHDLFKYVDLAKYGYYEPFESLSPVYERLLYHYEERGLSPAFCMDEVLVKPKPMYQPAGLKDPIWIQTNHGGVMDLMEVSTLPLGKEADHCGNKHLVFVWDKQAKHFLRDALNRHFGYPA